MSRPPTTPSQGLSPQLCPLDPPRVRRPGPARPVCDSGVCLSLLSAASDYSCALQREILLQGRLYLSENWICFYSNIFRWETTVSRLTWDEEGRAPGRAAAWPL